MAADETFDSIETVRAHFYPQGARLLEVKRDELLEFPKRLSEESLRMIQRIAASAGRERTIPEEASQTAKTERRDVVPSKTRKGWEVTRPGGKEPVSRHKTQQNAERAAKNQLARSGGEVVIHGRDGQIRDKDTIPPARDPNPPKDIRH